MPFILIVIGLIGLWWGTQWIIRGALGLADRYQLSHSFVGIAVLAIGTDLPEVFVSLEASLLELKGIESSGIITGNAIGSSITQITFILGIAGFLLNFKVELKAIFLDAVALASSILLLFVFALDGTVNRWEGSILLVIYVLYYILLLNKKSENQEDPKIPSRSSMISLLFYFSAGFTVLVFASHLVVANAMALADRWGVAQSFVGIAIIGLGTSLPELSVSIGAALKKSHGLSVGNIIGSNIFDGLIPIGLSGVISTTRTENILLIYDLPFLFIVSALALLFLTSKRGISKAEGLILVLLYFAYLGGRWFLFEIPA